MVDAWTADVHRWRVFDHAFFLGVTVEADDRAQPARNVAWDLPRSSKIAGEAIDVDPPHLEQTVLTLPAPRRELSQIQRVDVAGVAAVAGQIAEQCRLLDLAHHRLLPLDRST